MGLGAQPAACPREEGLLSPRAFSKVTLQGGLSWIVTQRQVRQFRDLHFHHFSDLESALNSALKQSLLFIREGESADVCLQTPRWGDIKNEKITVLLSSTCELENRLPHGAAAPVPSLKWRQRHLHRRLLLGPGNIMHLNTLWQCC